MTVEAIRPLGTSGYRTPWVSQTWSSRRKDQAGDLFGTTSNVFASIMQSQSGLLFSREEVSNNIMSPIYLQYPNEILQELAFKIVDRDDDNDTKMTKITRWVQRAIRYAEDTETYGTPELWAAPIMTLYMGQGDCEDGAFLIHSLGLNAGVPAERLRTYGGEVKAGVGAATGGHGWTAYRRESDNEWVVLDFSYHPTNAHVSGRKPMEVDLRYRDDYFFMTLKEFVETWATNRVRDPDGYNSMGAPNCCSVIGQLVDTYL